ncbi:MAG: pirin family protein [Sedimenticolaceae bacterium]
MSLESIEDQAPERREASGSAVERIITPKTHDLGGFSVRRALPCAQRRMIGPWIFFDHMGPANFPPGKGIDVRPHPHINLATVTYLFQGEMLHRDSLGNELAIRPGDINLMIAGSGIVHSERQRDEIKASGNRIEGLQLWLALPEADEEMAPEFHHYDAASIPTAYVGGVSAQILIGEAYGMRSPVKTLAETLYVEARLPPAQSLRLPESVEERAVYVVSGRLEAEESVIDAGTMAVFHAVGGVVVKAVEDTHLLVIGGERLSQRHIWWNFVSSRKARIEQAKQDWLSGAFPKVPHDEDEFIPLPEN